MCLHNFPAPVCTPSCGIISYRQLAGSEGTGTGRLGNDRPSTLHSHQQGLFSHSFTSTVVTTPPLRPQTLRGRCAVPRLDSRPTDSTSRQKWPLFSATVFGGGLFHRSGLLKQALPKILYWQMLCTCRDRSWPPSAPWCPRPVMSPAASNQASFRDVPGELQSSLLSASHLGPGKGPGVCTAHTPGAPQAHACYRKPVAPVSGPECGKGTDCP